MYGRCETDPFDQAIDVCDSCYGEFCDHCLVTAKGRKHPICQECVMVASGLRPGSKPLMRGSKKTAAARRQALQAAPRSAPVFRSFDAEPIHPVDPHEPPSTDHEPPSAAVSQATEVESDELTEPVEPAESTVSDVVSAVPDQPTVADLGPPQPDELVAPADPVEPQGADRELAGPPPTIQPVGPLSTADTDETDDEPIPGFRRPRPFVDRVVPAANRTASPPAPSPTAAGPSTRSASGAPSSSTSTSTSTSAPAAPSASPPVTGIAWTVVPEADTAPLPRRRSRGSDGSDHSDEDAAMETTSRR